MQSFVFMFTSYIFSSLFWIFHSSLSLQIFDLTLSLVAFYIDLNADGHDTDAVTPGRFQRKATQQSRHISQVGVA